MLRLLKIPSLKEPRLTQMLLLDNMLVALERLLVSMLPTTVIELLKLLLLNKYIAYR